MKTATFIAAIALMAGRIFADGADDALVSFSTTGAEPDRYADGTAVLDGECYALVWSSDGTFEGLLANGMPADPNDKVVLLAPVARNGHCPKVLFQIPASTARELAGGVFGVLLLDTRVAKDGAVVPRGAPAGKLALVNGFGAVAAETAVGAAPAAIGELLQPGGHEAASSASPATGTPQPRIKHIELVGDNVFLTVENLPGYMRVHAGAEPARLATQGAATETDGKAENVILVAPKVGTSGFYRVIRN